MKIPSLLKRPTSSIPLPYEKILNDRFNFKIPSQDSSSNSQFLAVKSIFGDLTTRTSSNKQDLPQNPFSNTSHRLKNDINFGNNWIHEKTTSENRTSDDFQRTSDQIRPTIASNHQLTDSSAVSGSTKCTTKDSPISPFKHISKISEGVPNLDTLKPPLTDISEDLTFDSSETTFDQPIYADSTGVFDVNGRYSSLEIYKNESVDSIVSRGVDVPEKLNLLIKERALRGLSDECLEILSEIKKLKIPLSIETYNNCLISCMKTNNAKLSRYLFLCLRSDLLTPDLRTYTLMIKTHVNAGDISSAFSLYRKMENEGTKADLVVFSVLIDCLVKDRQIKNAWSLFNYMRTWRLIDPDEVLFTIMIKSCSYSKEAEKALNLYQEMLTMNKFPTIYTYIELINCLSNRKEYFHQCFQFYNQIKAQEYPINSHIILLLLQSCCTVGNVRKAKELILESRSLGINPTLEMYNVYIKTLAAQMKLSKLTENEKINNINKTWSIVQSLLPLYRCNNSLNNENDGNKDIAMEDGDKRKLVRLFNSVILVYENGGYYEYAMDVLNCLQVFNLTPDYMTYFILLRMVGPKMKDPGRFFTLWSQAKTKIEPQKTLLCMALDMAILSRSAKRTLEILNDMYNAKVFPTPALMKKLYESGKKITQIHLMINNLVTLQRKITYQEKLNESKILQTYVDEFELNKAITPNIKI
uniref:PPR repeat family/Pentatricopeptide repeat domain/PPR repeat, putative n=1 Tax=Theileria annulata TaxID=5874 RepID=A0A3B0NA78_THEAN